MQHSAAPGGRSFAFNRKCSSTLSRQSSASDDPTHFGGQCDAKLIIDREDWLIDECPSSDNSRFIVRSEIRASRALPDGRPWRDETASAGLGFHWKSSRGKKTERGRDRISLDGVETEGLQSFDKPALFSYNISPLATPRQSNCVHASMEGDFAQIQ